MSRARRVVATALATGLLAGCGSDAPSGDRSASSSSGGTTTLTVFAAASLTSAFTELGTRFEHDHPGTRVRFDFGGSSSLVTQLQQGAPADVLATADQRTMKQATDAHLLAGAPTAFARNQLTIVTPKDNPARITALPDLARSGVRTVICAAQVPCGAAAHKVEKRARITLHPVSEENKVTDVLAKVASGDADAGLVYVTDAKGADPGKVTAIGIPAADNVVSTYPIGVVAASTQNALARQFVSFVEGTAGRSTLREAGFLGPT